MASRSIFRLAFEEKNLWTVSKIALIGKCKMKTKIFPPPSIAVHNVLVGPQDSLKVLSSAVVAVVHRRED